MGCWLVDPGIPTVKTSMNRRNIIIADYRRGPATGCSRARYPEAACRRKRAAVRPVKGYLMGACINGALNAAARSLALEFAPFGVRVNTIACGLMDTPLNDVLHSHDKEERIRRMAARLPTGRIGTAEEGAMGALYLMCNGYVTAQVLGIDGGQQVMD